MHRSSVVSVASVVAIVVVGSLAVLSVAHEVPALRRYMRMRRM
jgi:hypothetical protein